MERKEKVDLTIAIFLILIGTVLMLMPLINYANLKVVLLGVFSLYTVLNLIQFLLTYKTKDYEGLYTAIASLITIGVSFIVDIALKPWNLAIVMFVWIIIMSLIKLKKSDYYNDRNNKMWILRIITLGLFILTGLLTTINLYYTSDIQILLLGFFFLVHGILELVDPVSSYLMNNAK